MAKGWLKLYRQIQDNCIWNEKPFDKAHAWIDLLLMANVEEKEIHLRNHYGTVTVKRGSLFTSTISLSKRWGWSRNKVNNYLGYLKVQGMVQLEGTTKGTTITIVKYGVFQDKGTTKGTTEGTTNGTTEGTTGGTRHKNIYKNDIKKNKEDKEDVPRVYAKTRNEIDALFEKMRKDGEI